MRKPGIVCLCGSTKFKDRFEAANREFTLKGKIVLAPGVFLHAEALTETAEKVLNDKHKSALDALHFAKIDLADEVFVINPDGYIGESTAREIAYAKMRGKTVRYQFGGRR